MRTDLRNDSDLRPISFDIHYLDHVPGSVLTTFGRTKVLVCATVEERVPPHRDVLNSGWLTAEYNMLPASTLERKARKTDSRSIEIQRLIGRSMRAAINLDMLGKRSIYIDCDVLVADAGTRTAAISGAYVALYLCVKDLIQKETLQKSLPHILVNQVAAVSVGVQKDRILVDPCYDEDARLDADFNLVGCADGRVVEFQGTSEGQPITREQVAEVFSRGMTAIEQIVALQKSVLG